MSETSTSREVFLVKEVCPRVMGVMYFLHNCETKVHQSSHVIVQVKSVDKVTKSCKHFLLRKYYIQIVSEYSAEQNLLVNHHVSLLKSLSPS